MYGFFWAPAACNNILEVVIVEDGLVLRVTPETIIAGVLRFGVAERVRTRQGSYQTPSMEFANVLVINVLNENFLEVIASVFWIWHQTQIFRTFLNSSTTISKLISESCKQSSFLVIVIRIIVDGK